MTKKLEYLSNSVMFYNKMLKYCGICDFWDVKLQLYELFDILQDKFLICGLKISDIQNSLFHL